MSEVKLITGGARSGKSIYAEKSAENCKVLYIATAVAFDDEMEERIRYHQNTRPESWITWERYHELADIEKEFDEDSFDTIILDCVGNLLMGILYEEVPNEDDFTTGDFENVVIKAIKEIDAICSYAVQRGKSLIFITNEIGMGVVPETRYARYFRDALGHLNKRVARLADSVVLMVSGLPITLK